MLIEKLELSAPPPSLTNQTDSVEKENRRCVRQTGSGKWEAAIQNPITKISVWLGCYNTPNEAADVYIKKKLEFDSLSVPDSRNTHSDSNVVVEEAVEEHSSKKHAVNLQASVELDSDFKSKMTNRSSGKRAYGSGSVTRTKTGKWQAQISYKKSKAYLGTYTSYEEAEAAITKKRQDLQNVTHAAKESKRRGLDLIKNAEKKLKKSNEDETVADRNECGERNETVDDIQVPSSSSLVSNQEFDKGVINGDGELVGEFSRLDDDLWLG